MEGLYLLLNGGVSDRVPPWIIVDKFCVDLTTSSYYILLIPAIGFVGRTILSIYPLQFLKTGNVASVSGIMDFATYLGAGVSGVIYGALIKSFGYAPMFVSWVCISLISIILIKKIKTV